MRLGFLSISGGFARRLWRESAQAGEAVFAIFPSLLAAFQMTALKLALDKVRRSRIGDVAPPESFQPLQHRAPPAPDKARRRKDPGPVERRFAAIVERARRPGKIKPA